MRRKKKQIKKKKKIGKFIKKMMIKRRERLAMKQVNMRTKKK